jgi:hypothetical protein
VTRRVLCGLHHADAAARAISTGRARSPASWRVGAPRRGIAAAWLHGVRDAIDRHIEERRKDEQFKERLRQRHETERALYERLAR